MKIDLHTHILPCDWPDLDKKYGYSGFVRLEHHKPCCARMMMGDRLFREIQDNSWDPKRRIEECDAAGVSMQVLSTVPAMRRVRIPMKLSWISRKSRSPIIIRAQHGS